MLARSLAIVAGVSLLWLGACASSGLTDEGSFEHPDLRYRVSAEPPDHVGALLGPDWVLSNYTRDDDGRPSAAKDAGDTWTYRTQVDTDDDGEVDLRETLRRYDLHYEHIEDDARVWIQTFPVSAMTAGKKLETLAKRYADSLAGGLYVGGLTPGTVEDARYASRIVSASPTEIDGHEAYQVDIEVANVDQLRLNEDARERLLRVILVRTGMTYNELSHWTMHKDIPSVMILALSTTAGGPQNHYDALARLAARVSLPSPTDVVRP